MKDKRTGEALQIVTPQTYSLAFNGTFDPGIDPSKVWIPTTGKRVFTAHELYDLFLSETSSCIQILFLGDSTDRRAADTLHILLTHRHNLSSIDKKHYNYKWDRKFQDQTRKIISTEKDCVGSIDNMFRPRWGNLLNFSYATDVHKNYTLIIASTGPWNHQDTTPQEARENIPQVIRHLYDQIPDNVPLLWKTGSWSRYANWNHFEENQTSRLQKHIGNYQVHYANEAARETIRHINSPRLRLVDWSKEICPFVWEHKKAANMGSEDGNPWHMGVKARVLLIQMMAWEYSQYQKEKLGWKPTALCGLLGCNHSGTMNTVDLSTLTNTNTLQYLYYFSPDVSFTRHIAWIGVVGLVFLRFMRKRKINMSSTNERSNRRGSL